MSNISVSCGTASTVSYQGFGNSSLTGEIKGVLGAIDKYISENSFEITLVIIILFMVYHVFFN